MKLRISNDLSLPRDTVTQTMVVYGGKGMGKTNFGAVLCEECDRAGLRFSVIDPMGVFWGLRHSKDGKGPGIEVLLLGGKHGDIEIEPTAGTVVADLVADENVSVVIDISRQKNGKMWSLGERIRFVTEYTTRLYERQGERITPLLQMFDEAGRFVPQTIPHGAVEIAKCVGAIERMVEEGRNVAIGVCLITQRSARMNKSVSELADCMVAFRTVGPRSIDAILDWFGEHVEKAKGKELIEQLRALPRGKALVVSPGWLKFEGAALIRERETFDSSATPEQGKERRASGPGAKPDLERYRERMAATVEKAKAEDPKALRAEIAKLKRELDGQSKRPGSERVVEKKVIDQDVIRREVGRALDDQARTISRRNGEAVRAGRQVSTALGKVGVLLTETIAPALRLVLTALEVPVPVDPNGNGATAAAKIERVARSVARPEPRPRAEPRLRPPSSGDIDSLSKGEQKILDAMAELEAIGIRPTTRVQAGAIAGYTLTSGTGGVYTGHLISSGFLSIPTQGSLELTEQGRRQAREVEAPLTNDEMQRRVLEKLSSGERRILEHLISIWPESQSREDAGSATGYVLSSGTGGVYAGRLCSLGFVDKPKQGFLRANDLLFPEDR